MPRNHPVQKRIALGEHFGVFARQRLHGAQLRGGQPVFVQKGLGLYLPHIKFASGGIAPWQKQKKKSAQQRTEKQSGQHRHKMLPDDGKAIAGCDRLVSQKHPSFSAFAECFTVL